MDSHQWYCLLYLTPSDGEKKRVWKVCQWYNHGKKFPNVKRVAQPDYD